jgi:predicted alpha/beta hydrolase family esterase
MIKCAEEVMRSFMSSLHRNIQMKKNILFMHAAGPKAEGSGAFIDVLEKELGAHYRVTAPDMPDADAPNYNKWARAFGSAMQSLAGDISLVGHSLGGTIILKYFALNGGAPARIKSLHLVAVPYWGLADWAVDDFLLPKNYGDAIAGVPKIFLYQGTDDDVLSPEHIEAYKKDFPRAKVRVVKGFDHILGQGLPVLTKDILDL